MLHNCVRSPLPVEDQDREDIKGSFMEQSTEDIPLRKVVQDQLHQFIWDIDLGRCVCMCHKKLTSLAVYYSKMEKEGGYCSGWGSVTCTRGDTAESI